MKYLVDGLYFWNRFTRWCSANKQACKFLLKFILTFDKVLCKKLWMYANHTWGIPTRKSTLVAIHSSILSSPEGLAMIKTNTTCSKIMPTELFLVRQQWCYVAGTHLNVCSNWWSHFSKYFWLTWWWSALDISCFLVRKPQFEEAPMSEKTFWGFLLHSFIWIQKPRNMWFDSNGKSALISFQHCEFCWHEN